MTHPPLKGIMMSRQKDLPKLPIPGLAETMERLLRSLVPLVSPEALETSRQIIQKFGEPGGEGEYLHRMLTYRSKHTENWLDEWWLTSMYLERRLPLPVHSSPAALYPKQTFNSEEECLKYSAKLVAAVLEFKDLIDRQALPPDMAGHNPLDMSMYFKLFSVYRMPRTERDELFFYADGPDPPKHIVVMHNNQFFQVNVYHKHGATEKPYKERDLYPQFLDILEQSRSVGPPLGYLTTQDRDTWAATYETLAVGNEAALDVVQRSILILCLDEVVASMDPWDVQQALHVLVGGPNGENAGNRWYDKTVQFIVCAGGSVGMLLEHAPCDGTVALPVLDYCYTYMKKTSKHPLDPPTAPDERPKKIDFQVSPKTLEHIQQAKEKMAALARDVDVVDLRFDDYGKEFIKSFRMSPDSYIQMALQVAYYRLHGCTPSTYESASTRMFLLGRTETIRSQSAESEAFCRAYFNGQLNATDCEALLKKAVTTHKEYATKATYGHGVDRVMLGLQKIAEEGGRPAPDIFKDPGFVKGVTFDLSTSQVSARNDIVMAFGPAVLGGYGLCYSNQDHFFRFSICARRSGGKSSAKAFRQEVEKTLRELGTILITIRKAKL